MSLFRKLTPSAVVVLAAAAALLVPAALGGGAPSIAFDRQIKGIGPIASGTTASQTFTLTNTGGSATGALNVSISGPSDLTKTADSCTATSLGPNKSCVVTMLYSPTRTGAIDQVTLNASSKKPAAVATALLVATTFKTAQQLLCESYTGTYEPVGGDVVWACQSFTFLDPADLVAKTVALGAFCTSFSCTGSVSG
jgi:hypothetical protein